ncbi:MAG: DUF882 domain-containing protein [Labilithrix sp.]|nr:DUF882 domain-containing protein [Labilithrix sp.]
MRASAFVAMAIVLAASAAFATPPAAGRAAPRVAHAPPPSAKRALATVSAAGVDVKAAWATSLGAVEVKNRNTGARGKIRLYDEHGAIDRGQARAFMRIAGASKEAPDDASDDDERLDLRLVQLTLRAAYHFNAAISIVSGTRPGARGRHGTGEALDFALDGVKAPLLAAYLRGTPRAGVGIYTHPKTQYVHLDVRDHSFHWIDASPPGVTWREQLLPDPKQKARDGAWKAAMDLPEVALK